MDSEISHELYKVTPWANAIEFLFNYKNKKGGKIRCSKSFSRFSQLKYLWALNQYKYDEEISK